MSRLLLTSTPALCTEIERGSGVGAEREGERERERDGGRDRGRVTTKVQRGTDGLLMRRARDRERERGRGHMRWGTYISHPTCCTPHEYPGAE